ncbi:uncharacterized protein LOC120648661 [Panicum virgatum]|uniref:uncharacterized protein LOC120648661 n=1 Tax=Panicum virgatum TaxID=38727 RepID=UPI0019D53B45|nr:uncharacterized protein LOC120648661 [Panicum virgatum]
MAAAVAVDAAGSSATCRWVLTTTAGCTSYGELHCYGRVDFPKQGVVRQGHVGMLQLATCNLQEASIRIQMLESSLGRGRAGPLSNTRSATASRTFTVGLLYRPYSWQWRRPSLKAIRSSELLNQCVVPLTIGVAIESVTASSAPLPSFSPAWTARVSSEARLVLGG